MKEKLPKISRSSSPVFYSEYDETKHLSTFYKYMYELNSQMERCGLESCLNIIGYVYLLKNITETLNFQIN